MLMLASLFGRCIGFSAIVCVLLLFFFPLAQGNFQSTHGPITALRSKRSFMMLVCSIVRAALHDFAVLLAAMLWRNWIRLTASHDDYVYPDLAGWPNVLRC